MTAVIPIIIQKMTAATPIIVQKNDNIHPN